MVQDLTFLTKISYHAADGLYLRGEKLTDLIDQADFVSTFFLSLVGRKPTTAENKVLNAVLIAAIDHGIEPASGFVPRVVAASGNDPLVAMASALMALGPYHGGAITSCMEMLLETNKLNDDKEAAAREMVLHYKESHRRVPGYGHPAYKDEDPRTTHLFEVARNAGLNPHYPNLAQIMEHTVEEILQKKLVLNVDGAMAALLLALDISPKAGNAIFGVARVAGSVAHIVEEQSSGQWVRRLPKGSVTVEK
jgi:citrate synthase